MNMDFDCIKIDGRRSGKRDKGTVPRKVEVRQEPLNKEALFASETRDYRMPEEPEPGESVLLRFRTLKDNVDHVFLGIHGQNTIKEIPKVESDELFDYYSGSVEAGRKAIRYFFQVVAGGEVCYYNRLGATLDNSECFGFCITPGFHTPEWAKGAIMYQIVVDRFCNGNASNDVLTNEYVYIGKPVVHVEDWYALPEAMDVRRF